MIDFKTLKTSFLSKADQEIFISYAKKALIGFLVIILGIYVGNVLFGKASLEVLLSLGTDKQRLEQRINQLKNENSDLQKKFFELRQLDPDMRKE